jgi:hypothetical protein
MATTDFFKDSQAQFNESQKKFTELWEASQKELMESQKKLAETWTQSIPKDKPKVDLSESFEKTLNFQRELIASTLNAQQVTARLLIETQKQFWDDYFKTTQKMAPKVKAS